MVEEETKNEQPQGDEPVVAETAALETENIEAEEKASAETETDAETENIEAETENIEAETESADAETETDAAAENAEAAEKTSAETETAPASSDSVPLAFRQKTRAEERRLAAIYMIFAASAVFCVYIVQLFHFLEEPLFSKVYYGNLKQLFFYISNVIAWVPLLVGIHLLLKKYTGYKAFRLTHNELPLKRILILYACTVVPVFIVSAALGFELKVVYELGTRITGVQAWLNASGYLHGGVRLLFFVIFIAVVQEAGQLLYKGKFAEFIPWGGVACMLVFGFGDVIVAYGSGSGVLFAWLYLAFDLLYGVIYLVSKKSFYLTFILSLIIYIL